MLLRRWFWLGVLGTLLAGSTSYVFTSQLPKVYEGSAGLLVTPGTLAGVTGDYSVLLAGENLAATYAELAKTRPVVEAAVQAGGLDVAYEQASERLTVTPVRNTQLLQVTARGDE